MAALFRFSIGSAAVAIALLYAAGASAFIVSEVSLGSGTFPGAAAGGTGIDLAEVEDDGESSFATHTVRNDGRAKAAAGDGTVAVLLRAETDVEKAATGFHSSSGGSASAYFRDEVLVAPGTSGLAVGSAAQIQFQVLITGGVLLQGVPSSLSIFSFDVGTFSTGVPLKLVDFSTGNMNPEQSFDVDDFASFIVDVTVGGALPFSAFMDMDLGGTLFPPDTMFDPFTQEGLNFIDFAATVRVAHAPGFEGLDLRTEAGAPIGAIPIPSALLLLASSIAGLLGFSAGPNAVLRISGVKRVGRSHLGADRCR